MSENRECRRPDMASCPYKSDLTGCSLPPRSFCADSFEEARLWDRLTAEGKKRGEPYTPGEVPPWEKDAESSPMFDRVASS